MAGILTEKCRERDLRHRKDGQLKTEAEFGSMQIQAEKLVQRSENLLTS